jgi:hypothetical protein
MREASRILEGKRCAEPDVLRRLWVRSDRVAGWDVCGRVGPSGWFRLAQSSNCGAHQASERGSLCGGPLFCWGMLRRGIVIYSLP